MVEMETSSFCSPRLGRLTGTVVAMSIRTRSDVQAVGSGLPNAEDATRALKRLTTQGYDVDPLDSEDVSAYMTLREHSSRVDGKRLLAYLASKRTDLHQGSNTIIEYWAVPKSNFPDGLPDAMAHAEVAPEDLRHAVALGGFLQERHRPPRDLPR